MKKTLVLAFFAVAMAMTANAKETTPLLTGEIIENPDTGVIKTPPRGWNYIENGHLYVWYKGKYVDMGPYTP